MRVAMQQGFQALLAKRQIVLYLLKVQVKVAALVLQTLALVSLALARTLAWQQALLVWERKVIGQALQAQVVELAL